MPTEKSFHVVFHVDEDSLERQRLALGNVLNLLNDLGNNRVDVEVVFNGPAIISASRTSTLAIEFKRLRIKGVKFLACANSMEYARMKKEDLDDAFTMIPAGISHLVQRQCEGWAYVRP
jgi:Uncharacterized conserved protein, COG1416